MMNSFQLLNLFSDLLPTRLNLQIHLQVIEENGGEYQESVEIDNEDSSNGSILINGNKGVRTTVGNRA